MPSSSDAAKKKLEIGLVTQFLDRIGHATAPPKEGERPDFTVKLDGKLIGIEETKLHPDADSRGSKLRAEEERDARSGKQNGYWINPDFWPALSARIEEKIKTCKTYNHTQYDGLWLLITSGIPKLGAVVSTTIPSLTSHELTTDNLNARYAEMLSASPFEMVYWYDYMDREKRLFIWSRATGTWSIDIVPAPAGHYLDNFTFDELKDIWNDPEWRKNPEAKRDKEIEKFLKELANKPKA